MTSTPQNIDPPDFEEIFLENTHNPCRIFMSMINKLITKPSVQLVLEHFLTSVRGCYNHNLLMRKFKTSLAIDKANAQTLTICVATKTH